MIKIKTVKAKLRKWNHIFCTGMTCKTNAKRDSVIISALILSSALFIVGDKYFLKKRISAQEKIEVQAVQNLSEQIIFEEVETIQEEIDTAKWKEYRSNWYGFSVSYPETWKDPASQAAPKNSKWEYKFEFRMAKIEESNPYLGFDVVVYDLAKAPELSSTNEFPVSKNEEVRTLPQCQNIEGHLIETGDYPAEEIYLPPTDDCFEAALFFSYIRDRYIYNIVPVKKFGVVVDSDPRIAVNENFPEFLAVISTAKIIDIARPKAVAAPPKPKVTAPMPASYKVIDGRLVCAKKNDKPSKSDKNKKKHLDMECCLDPDETPNPHCYYPLDKYGKYLK